MLAATHPLEKRRMSDEKEAAPDELAPEAVLARATRARGDIFPEWKPLAYASPKTYHLVNETVRYLHHYDAGSDAADRLSRPMRELIAIPALCAKSDLRHAPNHVRRAYRLGLTNKALFEAASAFAAVVGWGGGLTFVSLAIMEANNPFYAFGELPAGGEPRELTPFSEMDMGRDPASKHRNSLSDSPEWQFIAGIDRELAQRTAAFIDHCLLAEGATEEILGPGPRELIATAALCTRGAVDIAADHIRRAYDCGMSRRQVLEAICCVVPMTGMLSAQYGARAMKLAEQQPGDRP
jgi:alkylhydroperoxidase/carboxymuconolactone decarboxylase family protein YurZ